jgi:hypothetical protein
MSGGNWYDRNAYIGVALPVFFTLFVAMAGYLGFTYGYNSSDQDHQSDYSARYEAQIVEEKCIALGTPDEAVQCYKEAKNAAREHSRAEQDLNAQREMANWAEGMLWATLLVGTLTVILTGLGVYWVKETLVATQLAIQETKRGVDVTERAFRVEQRAWLVVDVTTPLNWSYRDTALYGGIAVLIKNVGKTPAVRCRVLVDAKCADGYGSDPEDEQRLRKQIEDSKEYWAHFSAVLPGETVSDYFPFVALQPSRSNMMPRLSLLVAYDLYGGGTAYIHKMFGTNLANSPKEKSHQIEWLMEDGSGAVHIRSAGGGFVT